MKRRKILFLVSHPIQYNSPLFRELAAHPELELVVIYCSSEGSDEMKDTSFAKKIKWDTPLLEGYNYKILRNYSPNPTIFKIPWGLLNLGIWSEIRGERYDAVIIHGWHYATFWIAYAAALLKGVPIFVRCEATYINELMKPGWKRRVKRFMLGSLFKMLAGFLAIGSQNKKFYNMYGVEGKRIFTMPYSIDNEKFFSEYARRAGSKDEIRKANGIGADKTVILFVGKFIRNKRAGDIIMAYEKIDSEKKALIFVGDGALRKGLEEYVKEKGLEGVSFAGFKNQSEIYDYYAAADIFLLPSGLDETWGLAVNEAMCFHLPVVVSDMVGCANDIVKNGVNGYIFKAGYPEDMARHLDILINNSALREEMGKKSFEIIQNWNYGSDAEGLMAALNSLIGVQYRR